MHHLINPKSSANQGRSALRWSITAVWILSIVFLVLSMLFLAASYSFVTYKSPVWITPYSIPDDKQINTTLGTCVYPRLHTSYQTSDITCVDVGFCPQGFSCASLDRDTLICNNIQFNCPGEELCYNYISSLEQTEKQGIPVSQSNVDIDKDNVLLAFLFTFLAISISLTFWSLLEIRLVVLGDPMADRYQNVTHLPEGCFARAGGSYMNSRIGSLIEKRSSNLFFILLILIFIPCSILIACSLIVYIYGITPSIAKLYGSSYCVNTRRFYDVTINFVGWALFNLAAYLCANITLLFLTSMFFVDSLFRFWRSHVFFFLGSLLSFISLLAIIVEIINALY